MTKASVLLVEDERVTAKEIEYRLIRMGYAVSGVVTSGEEAVSQALSIRPDLIIMDVLLSGEMDGIEAAEKIREIANIPVIYLTATIDDEILRRAAVSEPYGYLIKPVKERELHVVIEIALYKSDVDKKLSDYSVYLENMVDERTAELSSTIQKLNDEIRERKIIEENLINSEELLRDRNLIIENDLKSAQLIQRALLPQNVPTYQGLTVQFRYLPLDAIGGDYFSFTLLSEGGLGVLVCDVESHGVSAALFTALVKFSTNNACRTYGQSPSEMLAQINRDMIGNMASLYLTAVYSLFQYNEADDTIDVTIASGGHPYPIHHKRDGEVAELMVTGHLIGFFRTARYSDYRVRLAGMDRLYLYTDGLLEVTGTNDELLGTERLREIIGRAYTPDLSQTLDRILDEIKNYSGQDSFNDDVLLIGFENSGSKNRR